MPAEGDAAGAALEADGCVADGDGVCMAGAEHPLRAIAAINNDPTPTARAGWRWVTRDPWVRWSWRERRRDPSAGVCAPTDGPPVLCCAAQPVKLALAFTGTAGVAGVGAAWSATMFSVAAVADMFPAALLAEMVIVLAVVTGALKSA